MNQKYRIMQVWHLLQVAPVTGGSPAGTLRWHMRVPTQKHTYSCCRKKGVRKAGVSI